jgi:hypothetical protein
MRHARFALARIFTVIMGLALLGGLFAMPNHMMSMPAMPMQDEMTVQIVNSEGHMHGSMVDNSSESCCDAVCPFSTACTFLVPQFADFSPMGDGKQFSNSDPISQLIYLTALAPPPKA